MWKALWKHILKKEAFREKRWEAEEEKEKYRILVMEERGFGKKKGQWEVQKRNGWSQEQRKYVQWVNSQL